MSAKVQWHKAVSQRHSAKNGLIAAINIVRAEKYRNCYANKKGSKGFSANYCGEYENNPSNPAIYRGGNRSSVSPALAMTDKHLLH